MVRLTSIEWRYPERAKIGSENICLETIHKWYWPNGKVKFVEYEDGTVEKFEESDDLQSKS